MCEVNYFSTIARTSRAERTRYSSPLYFTSVPPYLLYSTMSPVLTSSGRRSPFSKRPGPTARATPSWGFSLAVSGMTRPEAGGWHGAGGRDPIVGLGGLGGKLWRAGGSQTPPPSASPGG